jgi:hypothetical protein
MRAIAAELRELPPEDQPAVCLWLAERALLGLARASGPQAAAAEAYRIADVLAGVGA